MSDTKQPAGRLPEEPGYWTDLAARIDDRVSPALARRARLAHPRPVWWARPELSPALALAALVIVCATWVFVPTGRAASPTILEDALKPTDPLGAGLLASGQAPDLAVMVRSGAAARPAQEE